LRASVLGWTLLVVLLSLGSLAQEPRFPIGEARSLPILLLDQERLLRGSKLGQAFLKESRDKELRLVERRRRIDSELEAEEKRLTDLRDETPAEDFRKLADAFDEKVVRLRAEQEQASVELTQELDDSRKRFFQQAAPVITSIMQEFGALVVMEQRNVLVSVNGLNITNRAIAQLDSRFNVEPARESDE